MTDRLTSNALGTQTLQGLRVLVMEDRSLIAAKVVEALHEVGCIPVGPAATLQAGLEFAQRPDICIDVAVLDIDLRGSLVYPLAEMLRLRGVPLLFLTGYGTNAIPTTWSQVVRVEKPFESTTFIEALISIVSGEADQVSCTVPIGRPTVEGMEQGWDIIRHSRNMVMEARLLRAPHGTHKER